MLNSEPQSTTFTSGGYRDVYGITGCSVPIMERAPCLTSPWFHHRVLVPDRPHSSPGGNFIFPKGPSLPSHAFQNPTFECSKLSPNLKRPRPRTAATAPAPSKTSSPVPRLYHSLPPSLTIHTHNHRNQPATRRYPPKISGIVS